MTKTNKKIKILAPRIPETLDQLDMQNVDIEAGDLFKEVRVLGGYIEEQRADKVIFEKIIFEN